MDFFVFVLENTLSNINSVLIGLFWTCTQKQPIKHFEYPVTVYTVFWLDYFELVLKNSQSKHFKYPVTVYTVFWLDDFGLQVQNWYLKIFMTVSEWWCLIFSWNMPTLE